MNNDWNIEKTPVYNEVRKQWRKRKTRGKKQLIWNQSENPTLKSSIGISIICLGILFMLTRFLEPQAFKIWFQIT